MSIEILSLIAQFGFPAIMCVVLMWYCSKLLDKDQEESKEFIQAITNNTMALNELKMLVNQLYLKVEKLDNSKNKNKEGGKD